MGLGKKGFGDDTKEILSKLKRNYGKPSLPEIKANRQRLDAPMDRNHLAEVMLEYIEDIQLFAMSIPGGNHKFSEVILIDASLAKMSETGIYTKAIEKWNKAGKTTWTEFRVHVVEQYECMFTEMGGTTTGQMGYSGAFQAMTAEEDDDDSIATLNEEFASYAAKQSRTDSTVSGLSEQTALLAQQLAQTQAQLQAIMMNPPQQPSNNKQHTSPRNQPLSNAPQHSNSSKYPPKFGSNNREVTSVANHAGIKNARAQTRTSRTTTTSKEGANP